MKKQNSKKIKQAQRSILLVLSLFGILIFGLVIISLSVFGIRQNGSSKTAQPEVYQAAETEQSMFRVTYENGLKVNESNKLVIELDTKGQVINGAQIALQFDPDKVRFNDVEKGNIFSGADDTLRKDIGSDGKTWMLYLWPASEATTYNGKGIFAKVSFTPLKTDESEIRILCTGSYVSKVVAGIQNVLNCGGSQGVRLSNISGGTGGGNDNIPINPQPSRPEGCTREFPERPTNLKATTGTKPGQIHLTWTKSQNTSHYTVTYGEKWMDFKYGQPDIGDTDQLYVNGLKPGVLYYFVVTSVNVCASSGYSDGANAYAGKSSYTGSGTGTTNKPKATIAPTKAPLVATATPAYEIPPTSAPDDWDTNNWENEPTIAPEPTITPEETPKSEGSILLTLAKILPWIGLLVLVILGIMLVKFIKGGNDQDLPPIPHNFSADGQDMNQQPMEQFPQTQTQTQNPLAPPFGQ